MGGEIYDKVNNVYVAANLLTFITSLKKSHYLIRVRWKDLELNKVI